MRAPGRTLSVLTAATVLVLAGCGGPAEDTQQAADTASPAPASSTPAATPASPQPSPGETPADSPAKDDAVEIEVRIEDGQVTPSGERVDVEVGQPIRFVVSSDTADEIHVHATPERTFAFPAGAEDRTFRMRLTQPGVVEAELHELGDVVVTIAARP